MKKISLLILMAAYVLALSKAGLAQVEVGKNDQRLTFMPPFQDPEIDAQFPAIAYSPVQDTYYIVFESDQIYTGVNPPPDQAADEFEIFGFVFDPDGGSTLSVVSKTGVPEDPDRDATFADVVYNSQDDEYLVVWSADDGVNDHAEIFARTMGSDGIGTGMVQLDISSMGSPADPDADAIVPMAAYNSVDNQYLVIWLGDDDDLDASQSTFAIFGQLMTAAGAPTGPDDFTIATASALGPLQVFPIGVVHNPFRNEYVVAYIRTQTSEGPEIFGRRVAADGSLLGSEFQISDAGAPGDPSFEVVFGDLVFNPDRREYLLVWMGTDDRAPLDPSEKEVFGRRFDEDGNRLGSEDFRVSQMGPDGNDSFFVGPIPQAVYNPVDQEYLVVWTGTDDRELLDPAENEVYAQLLDADGNEIGEDDFRVSDIGPFGDPSYGTMFRVGVEHNGARNEYAVTWSSDDVGVVGSFQEQGENEIFVQRLVSHVCGNGAVEVHEDCDGGEGCDASCKFIPEGGTTGGTAGETTGGGTGGDATGGTGGGTTGGEASEDGGGCSLLM